MARHSPRGKKKVYITTDLEGASGLVTARHRGDIGPEGSEMYQRYRRYLTQDVNAAIEGACDGGARTVIVIDGHGTADHNIFPDLLDERALLERSAPGNWLPSLDGSFDALFAVGCHAMAGTPKAFLDHTQSSTTIFDWQFNGVHVGEIGQVAAIAGHFGAPLAFVTGDLAATQEARKLVGPIETVSVKEAISRNHARGMHPAVAARLIRQGAARAMERLGECKPCIFRKPITMCVTFMRTDFAEENAARKGRFGRLIDSRTVETKLRDIRDMFT